jgi:hypothetical protein
MKPSLTKILLLSFLAALLASACKTTTFSGRTPSREPAPNNPPPDPAYPDPNQPPGTGNNPPPLLPPINPGIPNPGGSNPGNPPEDPNAPPSWSGNLVFGNDPPQWHIGDNRLDQSSCKLRVLGKVFRGPRAYFCFKTAIPNLRIEVFVDHCGVDYTDPKLHRINSAYVQGPGITYATLRPLIETYGFFGVARVTKQPFPAPVTLGPIGTYQVLVESGSKKGNTDPNADIDDFNVRARVITDSGKHLFRGEVQDVPCF